MANCIGFTYIARPDARVLILGSLPGVESLKQQQYYAKKQNSFWRIMGELVGATPELSYEERLKRLAESGIALWDVCAAAEREGSLDSAILSPEANDFAAFFKTYTKIKLICFNGQTAKKLFDRHVRLDAKPMPAWVASLPHILLPSTSPAHAGKGFEQKLILWRKALQPCLTDFRQVSASG